MHLVTACSIGIVILANVILASHLTTEAFDQPLSKQDTSDEIQLAVVHAKWCGHCRDLLKEDGLWSEVKRELPGVRVVEIDEAEHPGIVDELRVKSFPSIYVMGGGGGAVPFDQPRTKANIVGFALKHS